MTKRLIGKKKRAFSLVEMLVSLAIYAILSAMLMQTLILNITLTSKINARSTIRSQLSLLSSLIEKDLRNASQVSVTSCGNSIPKYRCDFNLLGSFYWTKDCTGGINAGRVCKKDAQNKIVYESAETLKITDLTFETVSNDTTNNRSSALIIATIKAEASNPNWEVKNQVRQLAVSTRNYLITY